MSYGEKYSEENTLREGTKSNGVLVIPVFGSDARDWNRVRSIHVKKEE